VTHIAQDDVASAPQELRVPVDWGDAADIPTTPLNQFVCQVGPPLRDGRPDGIYLLLGNIVPPLFLGDSQEERQRFIDIALAGAKVQVHGRYVLSRERLDELIAVLQKIAEIHDSAAETARARAGNPGQGG
jgi:hypothetical protein